jgi:hypothetical protein
MTPPNQEPAGPGLLVFGRIGVVLIGATAAIAGLIEVLLSPLYIGSVLFPITILLAIATNVVLPILAREVYDSSLAAVVPVLIWAVVVLILGFFPAHGSVLLPGGGTGQTLTSLGLPVVGILAGAVTLARWPGPGGRPPRIDPARR